MRTPEEYRNYAEECRMIAATMTNATMRAQMLAMAEQWDALAGERAKTLMMKSKLVKKR